MELMHLEKLRYIEKTVYNAIQQENMQAAKTSVELPIIDSLMKGNE